MIVVMMMMIGSLLTSTATAVHQSAGQPEIINAINYGYIFTIDATVHTVHTIARLTFVIELPDLTNFPQVNQFDPIDCTRVPKVVSLLAFRQFNSLHTNSNSTHMEICTKFNYLINNLQQLSKKIIFDTYDILNKIYSLLDDFDDDTVTRNKRSGWFPILGRVLQTVTDVATMTDINQIKNTIQNLQLLSLNTSQILLNERNEIFSAVKLQSAPYV